MTTKIAQETSERKKSHRWVFALITLVFFLAGIAHFHGAEIENVLGGLNVTQAPGVTSGDGERDAIRKKIESETAGILRETDAKSREAYEAAIAELNGISNAIERAEQGIGPTVDELASFKGCTILCYLMAKDAVYGTCETEERIQTVIDVHIGDDILYAAQQRETVLVRLNDALARNATEMQVKLAAMGESLIGSEDEASQKAFRDFIADMDRASAQFQTIAMDTGIGVAGLGLSALLIKAALNQSKNLLGPIARRLGTSTAFSLSCAVADGPILIGDAIAIVLEIGGAVWCAYDLYHAQVVLKGQLTEELEGALVRYESHLLDLGKRQSMELLEAYHEQNVKMARKLANHFS